MKTIIMLLFGFVVGVFFGVSLLAICTYSNTKGED